MKIGQFFFISFEGTEANKTLLSFLNKIKPGGIIFFTRNIITPGQIYELIKKIVKELDYCPFLGIDLEGGKVNRFKNIFPLLPSFSDLGKIKNHKIVQKHAELSAKAMKIFGFNVNFSPVVDLDFGNRNGLETRTFGRKPELVTSLAEIYLQTFKYFKILTTLKHFPGLGRAELDTHFRLPTIDISFSELEKEDLLPFKKLKNMASFIMINHAHYTCFETEILPSSLSTNVIQNLLKHKLNYEGVIITDDLAMKAIEKYENAPLRAFTAGADMILLCDQPSEIEKNFQKFKNEYYRQKISENRLKQSFQRINRIKSFVDFPPDFFDSQIINSLSREFENHYNQVKKYSV
ncbi:hypothetical protein NLC26_01545 [Candidatus Aminicenantes bacterium AC-708-M15]|jgi:beta-N-acetylhexosaminidase|nr:hypothetical protein [SCandidatus Aminicenantes bacterium Aminicenantia_JdfR_composite]MCP2597199.1 hypothetical protein [Candidatus Aminicenantes bacterium AC-335-G13]MCP2598388.1 hypothetical protein [Candidatus Aminicenantes bacterium AC-335-L06]MCP2604145.1 hypothetical protein [Candidatus Aminicenantes bacterium AC-708-M15]MCP2617948.1 hypothetical protein [Candidatus Aminicenantes bacterium AC-335-A11]